MPGSFGYAQDEFRPALQNRGEKHRSEGQPLQEQGEKSRPWRGVYRAARMLLYLAGAMTERVQEREGEGAVP